MDKKPLIGGSILVVILLVLGSLSNVVGYQSAQTSQQNIINERINQKELLFQTIVDIANNKEIQRVILKSQMSRGIFPPSEIPVLTKNQIRQMYLLGVLLSRFIITSTMQSMVQQYHFDTQVIQEEIQDAIEKDKKANMEISRLKDLKCDCNNTVGGSFTTPLLCAIVLTLWSGFFVISILTVPILLKFSNFIANSRLILLSMMVGALIIPLYFAWSFTGLLLGYLMGIFCNEY